MHYEYTVSPRPAELGGGWKLQLLEDGVEVGGGVFPLPWENEPAQGIAWWNDMTEEFRLEWLTVAGSAVPAETPWQRASPGSRPGQQTTINPCFCRRFSPAFE